MIINDYEYTRGTKLVGLEMMWKFEFTLMK